MWGWALRASSKLLFFSTRTSSSSVISARLATASVQMSRNFNIVAVESSSWQRKRELQIRSATAQLGEIALGFGLFFLLRAGRVAGILCLPLLTWHCTQKPEGSALVRMRIYQAESVRVEMWLDRSRLHLEVKERRSLLPAPCSVMARLSAHQPRVITHRGTLGSWKTPFSSTHASFKSYCSYIMKYDFWWARCVKSLISGLCKLCCSMVHFPDSWLRGVCMCNWCN